MRALASALPALVIGAGVIAAGMAGVAPTASADTSTWAVAASPAVSSSADLTQVSCASDSLCVAFGSVIESWDGTSWSVDSAPFVPTAVSCAPGTSFCMAAGARGFESFDGSSWTAVASSLPVAQAISCATADYCVAVSEIALPVPQGVSFFGGTLPTTTTVETWDGSTWSSDPVPPSSSQGSPDFSSISCPDVDYCELVGVYVDAQYKVVGFQTVGWGYASPDDESWDGSSWSEPVDSNGGAALVSCSSANYCMMTNGPAIDVNGSPLAAQPAGNVGSWTGISCLADDDCVVVGSAPPYGTDKVEIATFDGTSWTTETDPSVAAPQSWLDGVSCLADGFCVGVGKAVVLTGGDGLGIPLIETTGTMPAPTYPNVTVSAAPTPTVTGSVTYTVDVTGSPPPTGTIEVLTPGKDQGLSCSATLVSGQGSCAIVGEPLGGVPPGQGGDTGVEYRGDANYTPEVTEIDQHVPSFTNPGAATAVAGTLFTFTVTTFSPTATPVMTSTTLPMGLHLINNGDGTATLTGTPALGQYGLHSVTLSIVIAGRSVAHQLFHLTIDHPPAFTGMPRHTVVAGRAFTYTVGTRFGVPTPTITTSSALPAGVTFADRGNGTAILTGTPEPTSGGVYHLVVTAGNGIGSPVNDNFILTVDQAPAITSPDTDSVTAGALIKPFAVTATGYPAPRLAAVGLPAGLTFSGGRIIGKVSAAEAGTHDVTLTAGNAAGATTQAFTLTVDP